MSVPFPPRAGRRALLLSSLMQSGEASAGEGAYDPFTTSREIMLGQDRGSAVAQMISWHEGFHAFLNASTCHGNAMVFAGALASAGKASFAPLVSRMLDVSLTTHETYATSAAIAAAGKGRIDPAMLADYPDYQPLLAAFTALFPTGKRPLTSVMALTSCVRAAMQTPVYAMLLATSCDDWPALEFDDMHRPDARFALMMTPVGVARAMAAIDRVLDELGPPYAALAGAGAGLIAEQQVWLEAPSDILDDVSKAAFTAFADILHENGVPRFGLDDQKILLSELIAKVEAYGGDDLKTSFHAPSTSADDEAAVFLDFRREQLVLSAQPYAARYASQATHNARDLFILGQDGAHYVQLVAMPAAKARTLYAAIEGGELLDGVSDDIVVGLRRRWAPSGEVPVVEFLLLTADELAALHQTDKFDTHIVCAASVAFGKNWFRAWITSTACPFTHMAVLIDNDPFDLMQRIAARGAGLHLMILHAISDPETGAHTEICCLTADDEPDVVYFTPCTGPFGRAVVEYAQRRLSNVHFGPAHFAPAMRMLQTVSVHALREEPRFGDHFWV